MRGGRFWASKEQVCCGGAVLNGRRGGGSGEHDRRCSDERRALEQAPCLMCFFFAWRKAYLLHRFYADFSIRAQCHGTRASKLSVPSSAKARLRLRLRNTACAALASIFVPRFFFILPFRDHEAGPCYYPNTCTTPLAPHHQRHARLNRLCHLIARGCFFVPER
jgi:hypothetical protein